jgi:hypothetical protein
MNRLLFPVLTLIAATGLCFTGKMGGGSFVWSVLVISATHEAENLLVAWKRNSR